MIVRIHEASGSILRTDADALVNPVNTVGVMGKGLADAVKRAFPDVFAEYRRSYLAGELEIGRMHVVRRLCSPRFVVNFPTKKHWRELSRLEFIDDGLVALVAVVRDLQIRSIAIPALACGCGGLPWREVYPRIEAAFVDMTDVRVLLYGPWRKDDP